MHMMNDTLRTTPVCSAHCSATPTEPKDLSDIHGFA